MKKLLLTTFLLLAGWNFLFCGDVPRSGIGVRGSAFGIPNQILDLFIYEHPEVRGESYAFEIRSYGSKGPRSVFSGVYSLEYSKMDGEGPWSDEEGHRTLNGIGEVKQLSLTATVLMNIFPSSPIHLYVGAGVGVGRISIWYEGSYVDELGTEVTDSYEEDRIIPVAHVPIGVIINYRDKVELRIEGGFKNGFYAGAGVVINF
jgi:opacity protein-like surface antigen